MIDFKYSSLFKGLFTQQNLSDFIPFLYDLYRSSLSSSARRRSLSLTGSQLLPRPVASGSHHSVVHAGPGTGTWSH